MSHPIIIIGSGLAGYNLAREFRKLDQITPLTIIAEDSADFYSKPMLSNALAGKKTAASLMMKSARKMAEELNAAILPFAEVVGIDIANQQVLLIDGAALVYQDLILALGADQIYLPLGGNAGDDVISVNNLQEYAEFAAKLPELKTVGILGAGLIGCEFANDLLALGIKPIVLDLAGWPLSRLLPETAGHYLAAQLTAAGVEFHFGVAAQNYDHMEGRYLLGLNDGSIIEVGMLLSAIGLRPRIHLAESAGLKVNRGIVVDQTLQTSQPHIYALGDCAEVMGLNLPFVMPIMHCARALAATLAGTPTPVKYPAMPVQIKTPACPTVVAPPAPGAQGQWQVSPVEGGIDARFVGARGELLGFALLGAATKEKQALTGQLPAVLA
ncbi:NAD(P)/FAD-dependent oxidoreductase [Iodobacter ciconiae]|uniref:FAD-dependent oxidoreductase n=1 Tax=Iodobacter ciconiae TaxID=2496266 RepID=A0A3S8ZSG1_9NEIS|nr:FAD-dependent oxidoreductase [Iodobacter ciconiae]AZN36355.1 FAD-dependent oxidoreductase [Iodobacter ciconiae]